MPDLGTTLSQARVARGLTLEDCERDTRISKRYLDALEREDWRIFPAPVYSRAFLRTYAQYLGLDAQQLLRAMQAATAEPAEIKPLPEVRQSPATGAINWPLAVGVSILIAIAGGFVWLSSRNGNDGPKTNVQASSTAITEGLGGGARPGRPVGVVQKGIVPDLAGVSVEAALDALRPGLQGLKIDPTIFRPATFIERSLHNLSHAMLIGCLSFVSPATWRRVLSWLPVRWKGDTQAASKTESTPSLVAAGQR